MLTDLSDPDVLVMLRTALGTARDASGRCACVADREAQLEAMLETDRARGNTPPPADRLIESLLAPAYFRALFDVTPLPAERVAALVEHALDRRRLSHIARDLPAERDDARARSRH